MCELRESDRDEEEEKLCKIMVMIPTSVFFVFFVLVGNLE